MVTLVKKEVEVTKEASEVMDALAAITLATKQALKDGFKAGDDLPVIVATAWATLPAAIQGVDQIPEEAKEQPFELVQACSVGSIAIAKALVKG